MSDRIAAAYASAGRQLLADAGVGATAAEVAFMGVVTVAAWWWRRGGRDSEADGAVIALVSDLAAADPITAAAAAELGDVGQGSVAGWMDRHFDEITETADSLLEAGGVLPEVSASTVLGLHPDMVEFAMMHRRSAHELALSEPSCSVADAVTCGAVAEAKVWHELVGHRGFGVPELVQIQLLDPLVRTAAAHLGMPRVMYAWRWIDTEWRWVTQGAAAMKSALLWEEEVMG